MKNKKYIIVHCSWQKKDKYKYCLKDFMEYKENNSVKLENQCFEFFEYKFNEYYYVYDKQM